MTLCACPHVGHYQASHFAVWYLMSSTTHLMCIKCGDSAYLLTRAARPRTVYPPWIGLDPCISSLRGDFLNALWFPRKFSPHTHSRYNIRNKNPSIQLLYQFFRLLFDFQYISVLDSAFCYKAKIIHENYVHFIFFFFFFFFFPGKKR